MVKVSQRRPWTMKTNKYMEKGRRRMWGKAQAVGETEAKAIQEVSPRQRGSDGGGVSQGCKQRVGLGERAPGKLGRGLLVSAD